LSSPVSVRSLLYWDRRTATRRAHAQSDLIRISDWFSRRAVRLISQRADLRDGYRYRGSLQRPRRKRRGIHNRTPDTAAALLFSSIRSNRRFEMCHSSSFHLDQRRQPGTRHSRPAGGHAAQRAAFLHLDAAGSERRGRAGRDLQRMQEYAEFPFVVPCAKLVGRNRTPVAY